MCNSHLSFFILYVLVQIMNQRVAWVSTVPTSKEQDCFWRVKVVLDYNFVELDIYSSC
jgi:hypothetical protein